jgi:anti-sigma factor RsiW
MMWRRHVHCRIAAYADNAVPMAERAQIESHLEACPRCRAALDAHRAVAAVLQQMAPSQAPAGLWDAIEGALDHPRDERTGARAVFGWQARLLTTAALIVIAGAAVWWGTSRPQAWDVVRLDQRSTPRVADGQWLETGPATTAAIRIGEIGRVDLDPDTRLQLVLARPDEHRLNLTRGRISVEIVAPPRVFFVQTPTSLVVDLGCAYTMDVDDDGGGLLRVTEGWAALEHGDRESLVPAGASARTRPVLGPGTPSFDDATDAFKHALERLDFGSESNGALAVVIAEARARDTLTLWHLMSRVAADERVRVFDRLVSLTPLPAGVNREQALALDVETLRRWREELAWTW